MSSEHHLHGFTLLQNQTDIIILALFHNYFEDFFVISGYLLKLKGSVYKNPSILASFGSSLLKSLEPLLQFRLNHSKN